MKNKNIYKGILALGSILALVGCGNSQAKTGGSGASSSTATSTTLNISTFALSQDIVEKIVMTPFKEKNNVQTILEVGTAAERLTKLKSGTSAVDVIELSQNNASEGSSQGLFDTLTEKEVPNIEKLTDGAKEVVKNGFGVPYAVNSIGIVYDKEALGFEIKSWSDLWKPELKGKIAIPDISTTFGPAIVYLAGDHKGTAVTTDKGEVAFAGLKELAPNVVKTYSKSSDLANMFSAGEISVAVIADFAYGTVNKAKAGLTYFVPETTYANYNTINVVKNAKNKTAAYAYINWRISKELAEQTAKDLNEAPVNAEVKLDEATAKNKTYGDVAKRAKTIDSKFVNQNLSDWVAKWNEILNK